MLTIDLASISINLIPIDIEQKSLGVRKGDLGRSHKSCAKGEYICKGQYSHRAVNQGKQMILQ